MNTVTACRAFLPTVKRPKTFSPRSLSAACHASGCWVWAASIGGLFGATVGATKNADDSIETGVDKKEGWLSDLVRDAIGSEQSVLVVRAQTEQVAASGTDSEPFRPLAPVSIALVASVFIVKVEKNGGSAM